MEETILKTLMNNNLFFSKSFTHLSEDLFQSEENSLIFSNIKKYVDEFSTKPSLKEIGLSIKESNTLSSSMKNATLEKFKEIAKSESITNLDFIISKTETWVQKQKLTQSIFKAADIIQTDGEFEPIVGMVSEALNVNFDTDTGLSYRSSVEDRAKYYHRKIQGLSTGIPSLDKALGGGYMNKTLNLISAPSHGGKCSEYSTLIDVLIPKNIVKDMETKGYYIKRKMQI